MKSNLIILLIVSALFAACNNDEITTDIVNNPNSASGEQDTINMPKIKFTEEVYEFGSISQGEKVKHTFNFTNVGKKDLVISSARASCGCTIPDWPRKPIKPGEKGEINVVFNSEGKKGNIHKRITVVANTQPSTNIVAIKGEVIAPSDDQ